MQETYTFIARSAKDPLKVATFTLHDHSMSVGIGVPGEQMRAALESQELEGKGVEVSGADGGQGIWLKPVALSVLDQASGPFGLEDVAARLDDETLSVTAWLRARGLRLAPVHLAWNPVDNPQAARGFVEELRRRKRTSRQSSHLPGILDYWWTWILGTLSLVGIGIGWILKRGRDTDRHTTSAG
jgi:hypothetical protein